MATYLHYHPSTRTEAHCHVLRTRERGELADALASGYERIRVRELLPHLRLVRKLAGVRPDHGYQPRNVLANREYTFTFCFTSCGGCDA